MDDDGWMTCNFTSFLTVFQSHQDDGPVIMKGYMQLDPVYNGKDLCLKRSLIQAGLEPRTTRSVGQGLTH